MRERQAQEGGMSMQQLCWDIYRQSQSVLLTKLVSAKYFVLDMYGAFYANEEGGAVFEHCREQIIYMPVGLAPGGILCELHGYGNSFKEPTYQVLAGSLTTVLADDIFANAGQWMHDSDWAHQLGRAMNIAEFGGHPAVCNYAGVNLYAHLVLRDTFSRNELEELANTVQDFCPNDFLCLQDSSALAVDELYIPNTLYATPATVQGITIYDKRGTEIVFT